MYLGKRNPNRSNDQVNFGYSSMPQLNEFPIEKKKILFTGWFNAVMTSLCKIFNMQLQSKKCKKINTFKIFLLH